MCKEILTLHIGQAGIQCSHALWELICIEHGVGSDGIIKEPHNGFHNSGENIEAMYYEIKNSRYVPRAILMDLEPTVVDEVRNGVYRQLWNPSNLVNQKEDAASNYARGYHTCGKIFLAIAIDRINHEVERCDNLAAFEIVHSFAGGTGSGFSSLLSERLSEAYSKVFKFSLGVFPSPKLSEIMVESYNAILHSHTTLENEDCVIIFDNESLFNKSFDKLKVNQPTFSLMNRLISQMFSSISLSHRYSYFGSQHADVTELLTNLIPYPRIHFPIMSYSPLISYDQQHHELFNCYRLTKDVFQDNNQVLMCSVQANRFMSCCMLYRGCVSPKPIMDSIAKIKSSRDIEFVEWCPTGFKIGINTCPPIQIPNCQQAVGDTALCMISGNPAIRQNWSNLGKKFDMLLSKRAFVHWYVSEGLEEGEFMNARDAVQSLILDYEELSNQNTVEQSLETSNLNVNNANIEDRFNSLNRFSSILSNVTNGYNDESSRKKYNQLLFTNDSEFTGTKISNSENNSNQRKFIQKMFNCRKELDKNKSIISNVEFTKPLISKFRNKTINRHGDKCKVSIANSQTINNHQSVPCSTIKRNRHYTKDMEVKDIKSTVSKYFVASPDISKKNLCIQKSFQIPLKRKTCSPKLTYQRSKSPENLSIWDSGDSMSKTSSSSKDIFKQCELMKNNNKETSDPTSFTGSYKTAYNTTNKVSSTGSYKIRNKPILVSQLLYSSRDTDIPNNLYIFCETEVPINAKNMLKTENPSHMSLLDDPNSKIIPKKCVIKDCTLMEMKISDLKDKTLKSKGNYNTMGNNEKIKREHLEFSKIEIVICEPLFI